MENFEANKITSKSEAEEKKEGGVSRRQFLKLAGVFTGLALAKPAEAVKIIEEVTRGDEQNPEKREPKISVEIFFASHAMKKDIENLENALEDADIFIPEMMGWNEKSLGELREVSDGKSTPKEMLKKQGASRKANRFTYDYFVEFYESFHDSKKLIEPIDYHEDDPRGRELIKSVQPKLDFSKNLKENVENQNKRMDEHIRLEKEREEHMLTKLKGFRAKIAENPKDYDVNDDGEIKILLQLGSAHTGLYHSLYKEDKKNVSRQFNNMPYQYIGNGAKMVRRKLFNKEVGDEMSARSILELVLPSSLFSQLREVPDDMRQISSATEVVANMFSYEEIKKIFESVKPGKYPELDVENFSYEVGKSLRKKDVKLPKKIRDLSKFVEIVSTPQKYSPEDIEERRKRDAKKEE